MDTERDDRFAVIDHDPRFRKISQKARKVKIDKRFHGMFKDDSFKLKYTVDKRGRPVNLTSDKHLRKFYDLSSSEDEESDQDGESAESSSVKIENRDISDLDTSKRRLSGKQKVTKLLRRQKERKEERRKTLTHQTETKTTLEEKRRSVQDNDEDGVDDSDSSDDEATCTLPTPSARGAHKGRPLSQGMDLARGQGNMESSSDSDSDSDYGSSDKDDGEVELKWGELDRDAKRSNDQSSRLALCNMDWDRVTVNDLLMLFNSFKPTGGVIHSVKVYPSDYGLEKMKQEDAKGPAELLEDGDKDEEMLGKNDDSMLQEKLRKYQLQRLRYYYAVIECDTVATASSLYDNCDGMEYLSSSAKLDLRFIPDDVTFDHKPKEVLTELPDATLYKPMEFHTTALHQSRVELTWDETSHQRTVKTAEAFKKKNIEDMDVSAFLASSSDEDGEERWELDFSEKTGCHEEEGHSAPLSEDQQIAKYRALLKEADKCNQTESDKQMEMEITWEPGLKDTAEELVKKKAEKATELTPWEKFLEKKKERKKKLKGVMKEEQTGAKQSTELAFSDDELPTGVNLNDSFFKDALKEDGVKGTKKSKKMRGRKDEAASAEKDERMQQKKSELELLFMDNDDGKKHFNLKQIMENEKNQGKKVKRKKRKQQESAPKYEDDFRIDVRDDRFQAMFTSHLYAMDPSDPQFKKTKAIDALLAERQRRIRNEEEATPTTPPKATPKSEATKSVGRDAELSMLVKSVKNKTDQFKERKLKRQKIN